MNKLLLTTLLATAALSGCLNDDGDTAGGDALAAPAHGVPSFEDVLPASVTGIELLGQLTGDDGATANGAGIWPYGDYVFGAGLGGGFWIADISDPSAPQMLFQTPEDTETAFSRDADIIDHGDGRLTLVLATQSDGMHLWDVTDPAQPIFASRLLADVANHNVAVVPGTHYVFNSQSGGSGTTNDLVDASDPYEPVIVGTYGDYGCHDISYFGTKGGDKFRAYCAGIEVTEIWDLDRFDPAASGFGISVLGSVDFGESPLESPVVGNPLLATYPLRTLHHLAIVNNDASVLIIGDEHNGGGAPGMCLVYDPVTGLSTPLGALWFYDITDEANPTLLSWISPPTEVDPVGAAGAADPTQALPNCTAHFGTIVPGEDKLVMAWYTAGILVIDFSDPSAPVILDQVKAGGNVWDARIHHGYVFSGDIVRGLDAYK
ncbi:MAG: LVIVD repeat-containing protein, partial [Thermoplasmatota archaeon]